MSISSGIRKVTQEELGLINKHYSKRELTEDEIFIFETLAASDDALTAYFSRLGSDMIENFNRDTVKRHSDPKAEAVGFLFGHSDQTLPSGTLFNSKLVVEKIDGKEVRKFKPTVYMPKGLNVAGVNTDDFVKAYEMGTAGALSISFMAGSYICDLCQNDIRSFECSHVPGRFYNMAPEGETPAMKQATYVIHPGIVQDRNLLELSAVYYPALPGARIESGDFVIGKDRVAKIIDKDDRAICSANIKDFQPGDILRFNYAFSGSIEKVGSEFPKEKPNDDLKRLAKNLSLSEKDKVELNLKIEKVTKKNMDLEAENKSLKTTVDGYVLDLRNECRRLSVAVFGMAFDSVLFDAEIKGLTIQELRAKVEKLKELRAQMIPVGRKTKETARTLKEESKPENPDLFKFKP